MSEEIAIDHSEIISTIFENENKTSWAYFFPFVFSNHLPPGKKIYIYENSDLIQLEANSFILIIQFYICRNSII